MAGPWIAVVLAWLSFELPMVVAPDGVELDRLRPTGEILVALTLCFWSVRARYGHTVRWMVASWISLLAIVRLDTVVFFVLTRAEPLLYDQLFMVRHALVLLGDLSGWPVASGILVLALFSTLVFLWIRALLRRARPLAFAPHARTTAIVAGLAWALVACATLFEDRSRANPLVRWMTPDLVQNIGRSRRIYRSVRRSVAESPYRAYETLKLTRTPDVFLFFVESYGKLLAEHPATRPAWIDQLRALEARVASRGFRSRSAYSRAPVSGGRSWLAVGSIFFGRPMKYEAVYRQLFEEANRVPHLVGFFAEQGYETMHLAPSDRPRPGVSVENLYGYRTYIGFRDLDYRGPQMGWGVVPDQYALGFVEEHFLRTARHPLFFVYHMVSSHAPWLDVPLYVTDWRSLNDREGERLHDTGFNDLGRRLKRYTRENPRTSYMGDLTATLREGYERSVFYDLRVLEDFILRQDQDALIVIMGDHQPPVVAPEADDFDVPVHVLSKDPKLLREFADQGFSEGLILEATQNAVLDHAGLFSLVVRALLVGAGQSVAGAPYLPHGVPLGE